MVHRTIIIKTIALALVALVISGCGGAEQRKARYLEKGKAYMEAQNYDKAKIEIKNALQIDPKFAEAYYLLGLLEEKKQNWQQAFGSYAKAVELNPEHLKARVRLGLMYLLSGNADKALEMADYVLAKQPDNSVCQALKILVMAQKGDTKSAFQKADELLATKSTEDDVIDLLSVFYMKQGKPDMAVKVLEKGIAASPKNVSFRVALAGIYFSKKDSAKAEELLQEIIRIEPDKLPHRVSLANFYSQLGQADKAEATLRNAVEADPADMDRHLLLANYFVGRNDFPKAETVLLAAIKANPDGLKLQFGLASLYERNGALDKAEDAYRAIIKADGTKQETLAAKTRLANLLFARSRLDESERLMSEVLEENQQDNEALLLKAKLSLAKGNAQDAITSLRIVEKDQPKSIEVLTLLASAHMLNEAPELAKESLLKAVELNPGNPKVRLGMAQFYVKAKDYASAQKWIDEALKVSPKDIDALQAKVEVHAAKRDLKGLQAAIAKIKEIYPDDSRGYYQMGQFYLAQKKYDAAILEFDQALKKSGVDVLQPLSGIVNAYMAQGKPERAVSRLEAIIEKTPDHRFVHELLAEVHIARKQYPEAEKALRQAIKANPKWNVPYRNLANLKFMLGDMPAAEEVYRQGLQAIPDDAMLLLHKAEFHERTRNFKEAIAAYERILSKNPNVHVAANNLAALLVDHQGDAESLKKARTLVEHFDTSSQPAFRDTLGWVYYKSGDLEKAVSILQNVVKQAPNVSVFRYHLGMAYYKQGNLAEAKAELAKASTGKDDFAGKDEARETLKKIP
ncbi:hypothetical protein SCL_1595 [Sulfuricaulis limicola]|uniref:Uncharacterized protein n=1 Tax=Sulfuricaulis limicola TaxID=1620215 RepID=A0A1B4XGF7_9GAMM|nr:tetratricopeptide repeat protein [Sulfuricaulis limicola]BAV33900.1 hypothetical protein SCL_1595 [Sulfuricaulis limicola]